MRERQRDYELLFIVSPLRSSEEEINATISRVQQAITAVGGEMTTVEQNAPWGRRKFAYPIRKYSEGEPSRRSFTEGYYVLCHFRLPTSQIGELERSLKLNDAVLRYLLTLIEQRAQVAAAAPVAVGAGAAGDDDANDADDDSLEDQSDEDEGDDGEDDA